MKPKLREATEHNALTAKYLRGIADPTRLTILQLLADNGEMNVGQLIEALGSIPQARVSDHLACLKWCHFVSTRRDGRFVYYRIEDPQVLNVIHLVTALAEKNAEQLAACDRIKEIDGD